MKKPKTRKVVTMKDKIKSMFPIFRKRDRTNLTSTANTTSQGEMNGLARIPVYNIKQMSDERWNELAAENKRKLGARRMILNAG